MELNKIIIVIPAYKAAKTLPSVVSRIPNDIYSKIHRILIVEDGGMDVIPSVSDELQNKWSKIDVLWHEKNKGYGAAQKTGFNESMKQGADIVILLHADGQYAPEIIPELLQPLINDECDIVLGSRMMNYRCALRGGMPFYKFVANILLTKIENIVFGMKLSEYHSGYMLYSRKALLTIPFTRLTNTFHFDGEMLMMGGKKKLRIAELPIPTHYGNEESHLKPIKYGLDILHILIRYLTGKYNF